MPASDNKSKLTFWARLVTPSAKRLYISTLTFNCLLIILIIGSLPSVIRLEVGKPAPWDIKASSSVKIEDEEQTQAERIKAAAQVPMIETFQPNVEEICDQKIAATFHYIQDAAKLSQNKDAKLEEIGEILAKIPIDLDREFIMTLMNTPPPECEKYQNTAKHLLSIVMNEGITEDKLDEARQRILKEADAISGLSNDHRNIAAIIASAAITANKMPDLAATEKARQEAAQAVEPSVRIILPGQIVIREGDIVGEKDIPVLEAMGVYTPRITFSGIFSYGVIIIMMLSITGTYLHSHLSELYNDIRKLLGLALLIIVFAALSRCTTMISPYLVPVPLPAMLIAILLDARLAYLVVCLLSLYVGIESFNISVMSVTLLTGIVSVLSVSDVVKRWDMIKAAIVIYVTNVVTVVVFEIISRTDIEEMLRDSLFYGGLNGLIAALVAAGALPILENALKVTTHIRLLELCNPVEPLLNELLTKAPGTYQHSIMVANIAEAAARAIGADSLLCRAGAYYHDIGKMKQPKFFVENQVGGANPHDTIPPDISAMILIDHVKHGIILAKQHKLPEVIAKFIPEHHGKNLASFFYQKALKNSDEPVFKENFEYPGPKPQSRETALVMLCDGIEAASRTLAEPNKDNITALVEKMVTNAITNQQLDECNLSLKDINKVKDSIITTLTSHYHSRIAYPEAKKPNQPNQAGQSATASQANTVSQISLQNQTSPASQQGQITSDEQKTQ